jgi:hypothetical protein
MAIPAVFGSQSWTVLMGITFAMAAIASFVALRLQAGYVKTLAESLHEGSIRLSDSELADESTIGTLTATAKSIDRQALLREISKLHKSGMVPGANAPPNRASDLAAAPRAMSAGIWAETLSELMSGDPAKIKKALGQAHGSGSILAAHVIPLLENPQVVPDAVKLLRELAPRIVGQLIDTLVDETQPVGIRKRIPRVLKTTATQRAVDGLMIGLRDPELEVRRACARALYDQTGKNSELRVNAAEIYDTVHRDLRQQSASQHAVTDEEEEPSEEFFFDLNRDYLFWLLSLVLDREPLSLAYKALKTSDGNLRGTALEYLENVLPHSIREDLFARFDVRRAPEGRRRSQANVVNDLMNSRVSIEQRLDEAVRRKSNG